jgi:hypothetical protein
VRGHSEREAPRPRAGGLLVSRIIARRELKDGTPFGPDAERVVAAALPTSHLQQVCPGMQHLPPQWNWVISRQNWDAPFATRQRLLCLGLDRAAPRCISWLRPACVGVDAEGPRRWRGRKRGSGTPHMRIHRQCFTCTRVPRLGPPAPSLGFSHATPGTVDALHPPLDLAAPQFTQIVLFAIRRK